MEKRVRKSGIIFGCKSKRQCSNIGNEKDERKGKCDGKTRKKR